MRQGDIWTVSGGKHYAGKLGAVVIVQVRRTSSAGLRATTRDVRVLHSGVNGPKMASLKWV